MVRILKTLVIWFAVVVSCHGADKPVEFTLMSYNVWKQWSQVDDGFHKGIESIKASHADVVGLQEATTDLADKVAKELGWFRAEKGEGTAQILSRYPIVETVGMDRLTGARIKIDDTHEVVVFNCHLDYRFYGPYAANAKDASSESVLAEENRSERAAQMKRMLEMMKPFLDAADKTPVFLTGDFNGPSHLDWTEATRSSHGNVGVVAWPASTQVIAAGMTDSFRAAHPDPVADPGNTWSTIHKATEPQDRIDFNYHKGKAVGVIGSKIFATQVQATTGAWTEADNLQPIKGNTWPSDHFAVITRYHL